ncbi:MAG: hypothetical protein HFE78_07630 [Clostridiales bacterium]|nr:hypothetical protein [Clostridiales bacterium]
MKHRNIPFGYCYENGTICINKAEEQILDQIFRCYISGMSLLKIAEKLNQGKVEYMPGIIGWNKARLMRIIDDKRYIGDGIYPAVIPENTYSEMQELKCKRNTQKNTDRSADIFNLNLPELCPICNHRMQRRHDMRCKIAEQWACSSGTCKTSIAISDSDLLQKITDVLKTAVDHPEMITVTEREHMPSDNVQKINAEIVHALETCSFQKDSLYKKMMTCVSLKYAEIDSEKYISQRLKADFEKSSPLSAFPAELCQRTVKSVHLGTDRTVYLTLINHQKIGKGQII